MSSFRPLTEVPKSKVVGEAVNLDVSTSSCLSLQPRVADVYETATVSVRMSLMPGAGEGLFAKRTIYAWEYCAWYNGTRCTHQDVNARNWEECSNTITLDKRVVLDVPRPFARAKVYCATLGHKANHHRPNNARYEAFEHPRFGMIKCVQAITRIRPGEEVCVDYGYGSERPAW
eukprot:CAMPEP_0204343666 /NCGR_PEP_ID=MMETSP0469-20131031/25064_1 /ASSEMBLY_ACC=CAM_ASM_000384 /TAXON_ID=2969 /ORGANISM="Oxyrrhis marina" /LENGTH=173 /DNA_ID=CAMNT_0051328803 /DNA_START=60 /DNA_END=578 /DNA_ORIENTATION=-